MESVRRAVARALQIANPSLDADDANDMAEHALQRAEATALLDAPRASVRQRFERLRLAALAGPLPPTTAAHRPPHGPPRRWHPAHVPALQRCGYIFPREP